MATAAVYTQAGMRVTVTAPTGGYTSKIPFVLTSGASGMVAVPLDDIAAGSTGEAQICGVWECDAESGTGKTFAVNDTLYWDATNKKLTKTATGNTLAGKATAAKLAAATRGYVRLNNLPCC